MNAMPTTYVFPYLCIFQVSEAAISFHTQIEEQLKDAAQAALDSIGNTERTHSSSADEVAVQDGGLGCGDAVIAGDCIPTSPTSNLPPAYPLPLLVVALADAAHDLGADLGSRNELVQAVQGMAVNGGNDVDAAESIMRDTLRLVQHMPCWHLPDCRVGQYHWSARMAGGMCHCRCRGASEVVEGAQPQLMGIPGAKALASRAGNFLALLAEVWGSLNATSPFRARRNVEAPLKNSLPTAMEAISAFEDLIFFAALTMETTWCLATDLGCEGVAAQGRCGFAANECVGKQLPASWQHDCMSSTPEIAKYPPWAPAVELLSGGIMSVVKAENILLSCIHAAIAKRHTRPGIADAYTKGTGQRELTNYPSRIAVVVVVTAVVKGYHSWATKEDMSRVLLVDLLDYAADALTRRPQGTVVPDGYHPMDLGRIVGLLATM